MNIAQIETALQKILKPFNKESFIYDLLLAYGQPKASIKRLQEGGLNLSKTAGEIIWKKKLFFKPVEGEDLHVLIDTIKADDKVTKHDPRFIIVTDFQTLLAIDRKTSDTLDIPILEIAKHFDFFLPWAGMEKAQHQNENPADVKAAERMAKLYDEIKKDNPTKTPEEVHNLNVFLSRLLFCFFAEDTGIFEKVQFTNAISSHTQTDGSDLQAYLDKLFVVMNTENSKRKNLPHYLDAFPYVNGGLFRNKHQAPAFTRRSRQALIDSGQLEWKDINPDIFGSMIQAVITPEHRGGLGMHYTSVPNIMKVIEPLFLNELNEAFESAKGNNKALNQLLQRIWNIKLFDPACGSGNFLIIAYKELRRLEMRIFKALSSLAFSNINLGNFYGIELDDFAHEIATLSLWLAEHQMNQEFFKEFGRTKPALPLKETGNIVQGNATRVDWEKVCPKIEGDEIYILGNPPYYGARVQDSEQKTDVRNAYNNEKIHKDADYISCWFIQAAEFIENANSRFAFVSTNSICQGDHVAILWPRIFKKSVEIFFAYEAFKWSNNAKDEAGVTCIIVGLRNIQSLPKFIYKNQLKIQVSNINGYLANAKNIIVEKRADPISPRPKMVMGSQARDGGFLILSPLEKEQIESMYPAASVLFRKLVGSEEFINGIERWCIWISDNDLKIAESIPPIQTRIKSVYQFRISSKAKTTNGYSAIPHKFAQRAHKNTGSIIIPAVSSERRDYIPFGFMDEKTIISNRAFTIHEQAPYIFAFISSKLHMVWVKATAGRLETRINYSSGICYNNFPMPMLSDNQKESLAVFVFKILEERESHSEKTLAQLYDPDKMPPGLKEAHHQLDLAVERCYRSKPFESDEERLEYLFKLYEQMIEEEKTKGTLFEVEKRPTKKKK
ncbi:class I SAM-dependent DNA methyltransferase [Chryseolinea lacunae]|uniref:site-specific DNA-methyltransferase (adenine-specific) n=1 Tax=Chryseolinea lacunae TaxID=2801331 RepID=A0ABS1L1X6_9BACT|nr:DNA methyltransferase [Chryseolinea lacunae]MBL0745713.1 class I SAM-dependent DNA methyltransferase [Chryseolinea lacunae]